MVWLPIVACSVGALVLLWALVIRLWKQSWIETKATLQQVSLVRKGRTEGNVVYVMEVGYRYRAGGRFHDGTDAIVLTWPYHEEEREAARVREEFKSGEEIVIYFPWRVPSVSSTTRSAQVSGLLWSTGSIVLVSLFAYAYYTVRAS